MSNANRTRRELKMRGRHRRRPTAIVATLVTLASAAYAITQGGDAAWNLYFHNRVVAGVGWQASDGAQTASLPNGRTVWEFGDTALNGSYPFPLINNSIAVHDTGASPPGSGQMRFYAKNGSSRVDITSTQTVTAAWFPSAVDSTSGAIMNWWWPDAPYVNQGTATAELFFSEVGCVGSCAYQTSTFLGMPQSPTPYCCDSHGVPNRDGNGNAIPSQCVFGQPVCPSGYSTTTCGYGTCRLSDMRMIAVYALEHTGVTNGDARQWTYPVLPWPIYNPNYTPSNPAASPVRIEWGQSFVSYTDGYVYIFGTRHSSESNSLPGWPSGVFVSRALPADVPNYANWQFLTSSNTWTSTPPNSSNCNDSACSYRNLWGSESADLSLRPPRQLSVQYINWQGAGKWVAIENHPGAGNTTVDLRVATSPTAADWSIAYSFDAHAYDTGFTTNSWSVWAHPELSTIDNTTKEYWLRFSYWAGGSGELHFQNFPLHQIRPWCTQTGHTCLN